MVENLKNGYLGRKDSSNFCNKQPMSMFAFNLCGYFFSSVNEESLDDFVDYFVHGFSCPYNLLWCKKFHRFPSEFDLDLMIEFAFWI